MNADNFTFILTFILLGLLFFFILFFGRPRKADAGDNRKCLVCGFEGKMNTWLRNYNAAQLIAIVLMFIYIIPGLIFIAWAWGKFKCPNCGALGKNTPFDPATAPVNDQQTKKCPFCAEEILAAAVKCKHCGSDIA